MIKCSSLTDVGKKRKENQDSIYVSTTPIGLLPNLFLVADGMGGRNGGALASKTAIKEIVDEVTKTGSSNPETAFTNGINQANAAILKIADKEPELEGMGTTLVAATVAGNKLVCANIGDSRLYLVNEKITQITEDHSMVEEMVRMGTLNREDVRNHPSKNIITRAVGVEPIVNADFFTLDLKAKDIVLMCTDGLCNMLTDDEIRSILMRDCSLDEKCNLLVFAANERGGTDNISVLLIDPCI